MNDSYTSLLRHTAISDAESATHRSGGSRKRKWGQDGGEGSGYTPIHIVADENNADSEALCHILVIRRAHIPLSFLDPSQILHRRFHCRIPYLEESGASAEATVGPLLAITRSLNGELFAVERAGPGEYVLCKLRADVTAERIEALRTSDLSPCPGLGTHVQEEPEWWHSAVFRQDTSTKVKPRKAPRLSMDFDRKDMSSNSDVERHSEQTITTPTTAAQAAEVLPDKDAESAPDKGRVLPATRTTFDEAFAAFIGEYLDMLYKSKTSVAYFAKANMSRLKASAAEVDRDCNQSIINFLSDLVMSSAVADKKHKNVWPDKVKEVVPGLSPSKEEPVKGKKTRKRKTKVKLDKRGMLHDEETYFLHWWSHGEDMPPSNETVQVRLRRRSLGLRTREAFLQIILMLEIASLEYLVASVPQTEPQSVLDKDSPQPAKSNARKSNHGKVALELQLDRLCIWHSLDHSVGPTNVDKEQIQSEKAPDQLRSFCTEVVVPFYMSKIPALAGSVNKKLGGPSAVSATKRGKSGNKDDTLKANEEQAGKKRRQPLQRVPSERKSQAQRPVPSLPRAATDSQLIPGLKREASEVPMDSVPLHVDPGTQNRKSSALDKMKLRQREVDFDAMSQAQETRRKKQADVESKLKEAISALKKPNRMQAGKELADVAIQRELMAQARDKASKAQKARQRSQIQVDATPKRNRIRPDLVATTPEARIDTRQPHSSSTISMIPSSGYRPQSNADEAFAENSILQTGHRPRHLTVDATPIQAMGKFAVPAIPDSALKQDAVPARRANIFETPIKHRQIEVANEAKQDTCRSGSGGVGMNRGSALGSPPIDFRAPPGEHHGFAHEDNNGAAISPEAAETPDRGNQARGGDVNIYDALGWNDL